MRGLSIPGVVLRANPDEIADLDVGDLGSDADGMANDLRSLEISHALDKRQTTPRHAHLVADDLAREASGASVAW